MGVVMRSGPVGMKTDIGIFSQSTFLHPHTMLWSGIVVGSDPDCTKDCIFLELHTLDTYSYRERVLLFRAPPFGTLPHPE